MNKSINSSLKLDELVFNKINFTRIGLKNVDSKFSYGMNVSIKSNLDNDLYKVSLILNGKKENEYELEIELVGFFSLDKSSDIGEKLKMDLIQKNTVAIMMPYLRSQVSIITAQPYVDCVVLPPFNINNLMSN